MPSKRTTTVVLTEKARKIKDVLSPGLGLKGILSVGLELFDKLSDKEKIRRVGVAITADKTLRSKSPLIVKTLVDLIACESGDLPFVLDKTFQKQLESAMGKTDANLAAQAATAAAHDTIKKKHIPQKRLSSRVEQAQ